VKPEHGTLLAACIAGTDPGTPARYVREQLGGEKGRKTNGQQFPIPALRQKLTVGKRRDFFIHEFLCQAESASGAGFQAGTCKTLRTVCNCMHDHPSDLRDGFRSWGRTRL